MSESRPSLYQRGVCILLNTIEHDLVAAGRDIKIARHEVCWQLSEYPLSTAFEIGLQESQVPGFAP